MYKKIKTALASFGMSGLVFHGPSLKVNSDFEVVQVLERTKSISKKLFPGANIVRNFNEILENSEIELVIINTPDSYHFEMAKQALNAGKNVVVEKPITLKSSDAEYLVSLAKENGVLLTVYQNRRWDNDFLTVQKVLDQGNLGRLVEFESHFDRYRTFITPNTWKEKSDKNEGVLFNLGSHMVDQVYVLFGKPISVAANLKIVRTNGNVPDYYDIRLEYKRFSAILKCSYLVKNPGPRYSIHGEFGSFLKWGIDPQEEMLKAGNLPESDDWGKDERELWGEIVYEKDGLNFNGNIETIPGNYSAFYVNVFDAIRNKAELVVKPEESVEVLKILEACVESNRDKKTIFLK
ncbi:MAG: Gfo/Idh/MocA family oxidoreductase [Prolixibacteraceae bacterium]|jgi:scyllo-inositol 2-dehydrogenase (NADP+)|nr:Gfo/Idh/MocA family oxidoreductase [Prolixibacteraceae bacterium]MBT6005085.1 Gfo/Idh/MocA family oxidoreductase [Prolixibacteraceae bacterium]MBT6765857.1 Gfo/Idh/MocA family oxidoreductase [Prolixibacteraceae bacterium]MBT6998759.1 Gfo/Idh/MocA family oxidoreductase [Prolixibacteraceae bacterium]MBT7394971.1 Gfo/Idh/MocA family oxidoreductase [Prolixibacteraceae bacterium]